MTTFAKTSTTRLRTFAALPVALLSAMLFVACGSGPQAALPFAPSALPSSTLALEAPEGIDAWGTLGKGNDKEQGDKGKNDKGKGKDDADLDVDVDVDVDVDEDAGGLWEGTVSSLSLPATCPAITFVVATRTVVTDAATKFQGGTCLQVLNDVNVRVRGTLQTNGTVLASRVKMGTDDDEVENPVDDEEDGTPHHGEGPHDGTVSSFRGVCPTVTFNLKGLTIVADGTTAYVGGDCATLRPNVQVVVTGALAPTAPRTFNAATITITRTH